ncbi:MAG: hypothetical protein ACTHY0_04000 [Mammaliicoccus vitulinus]
MKTVREVADELNISRQAVYNKLTVNFKDKFTSYKEINNRQTLVIERAGIDKLKLDLVKENSQVDSKLDNLVDSRLINLMDKNIETLQDQLLEKDKQISELNERLKEAQELNKNNQVLLHRQQDKQRMIEEKKEKEPKKKWWNFFKKDK